MIHMMPDDFEALSIEIAKDHVKACYISARFILDDGSLSCGLFSPVTHEVLASVCE